jgi:Uri superfamily endonuclease
MSHFSVPDLPAAPGTYALLLQLDAPVSIDVGGLGTITFAEGDYVYAGSARGPGGLRARVRRHARVDKRFHWHIDYLLAHAKLVGVHAVVGNERLECTWAIALARLSGARVAAPGFGASDCRCRAHLVHFPAGISMDRLRLVLDQATAAQDMG